jgi:sec-independent protein translocase protein TatA
MHSILMVPLFIGAPMELGVIFLVVLILFGPGKLPEVFKSLGEGVRQFKNAANGVTPEAKSQPSITTHQD